MGVRLRAERGQVLPLAVVFLLFVLVGMAALVVDVGLWFRADRQLQTVADAAVMAAVQELPSADSRQAALVALEYAAENDGAIEGSPQFSTRYIANDTIALTAAATVPTVFARIFGLRNVTVKAHATARATAVDRLSGVIPIGVSAATPELVCGAPCFGRETALTYGGQVFGAPGGFGLLDLGGRNGAASVPVLAGWLRNGFPGEVTPGPVQSEPGNKFNAGPVRAAIRALVDERRLVLLPVVAGSRGGGAKATYDVVGFAAFRLSGFSGRGARHTLTGTFEQVVMQAAGSGQASYFGIKSVALVENEGRGRRVGQAQDDA